MLSCSLSSAFMNRMKFRVVVIPFSILLGECAAQLARIQFPALGLSPNDFGFTDVLFVPLLVMSVLAFAYLGLTLRLGPPVVTELEANLNGLTLKFCRRERTVVWSSIKKIKTTVFRGSPVEISVTLQDGDQFRLGTLSDLQGISDLLHESVDPTVIESSKRILYLPPGLVPEWILVVLLYPALWCAAEIGVALATQHAPRASGVLLLTGSGLVLFLQGVHQLYRTQRENGEFGSTMGLITTRSLMRIGAGVVLVLLGVWLSKDTP